MRKPLIIAHRGDSSHALENSPEAFRLAVSVPADMIEFDVRVSRDQALYVLHDKQTGRVADRDIDVELASSREIAGIRLRNGEAVPTLDDVLGIARGRAGVNIEIKSDGAGVVLARYLAGAPYAGTLVVSSFKEAEVQALRRALPDLPCAVIYDAFSAAHIRDYRAKGYTFISLRKNTVTEQLVKACHENLLRVFVWTVDEEDELKRLIGWDVDGIYTNKPGLLKELLAKQQATGS